VLRRVHSDVTKLNRYGLVSDELTNGQAGHLSPTPLLDSAYCYGLLLTYWSVCQKLNRFTWVQLHRSVRAFTELLSSKVQ